MELSEPCVMSGPLPLPPVELPAFIAGVGEPCNGTSIVQKRPKITHQAAGRTQTERKGGVQARGIRPGLDGGLLTLFEQFCTLTPGSEDSVAWVKQLPEKLVALGEGVGQGAFLRKDSFLWNAWRHAWLHALSKSLILIS